jgi:hypothetical protein
MNHASQRAASRSLQFCVISTVSTERLNHCLDAASKGRFCLMSWAALTGVNRR